MRKKLFHVLGIVTVLSMLLAAVSAAPQMAVPQGKSVQELAMFQGAKFDAHYRVPNEAAIENLLAEEGVLLPGVEAMARQTAVADFMREFNARNPDTPNPVKLAKLLEKEKVGEVQAMAAEAAAAEPQIMSLAVPVEFAGEDTFDWCGTQVTTKGPLHNETDPPGPRDNNTIWYEDTTPALYNELYFGVGPDAGVIVNHPNLGAVDLRGSTMANYYLEQSEGAFQPKGEVYPNWLQASRSEGWYGQDGCDGANHNLYAHDLVLEVIDLLNADNPDFPWQDFDGNGDGIVDNFTVIHAGYGQESGGGIQGDFAIWSHASLIEWPTGKLACAAGSTGCAERDIFVREYSMDPEHIDIGVIAEEFGHAAFGLPDIYTTDYQASVSNWAIMEAGSWNGPLGGMQPAPFPLWFRYLIGWSDPVEMDYDDRPSLTLVGQHSLRPKGTEQGLKINLPDKDVTVSNPLGTGQAWWSDVGDLLQNTLTHEFDLTSAAAPIFSFASYWSIEENWDYGYVEVSDDGGATWTILDDMDAFLTDANPNGSNQGWGLTGESSGVLRFDLSAYTGGTVQVRLRYSTDLAAQWDGWWGDDFSLDDGTTNLFSDDVETGGVGWTAGGWVVVPFTQIFERYYLVEWRNHSGFDRGLEYPYQTVYSDEDEWEVDRSPYTVPGMLLWYRDASYAFDYTLSDSWFDPPSYGPKHGLLVVDSHPFPHTWDKYQYATGAGVRVSGRVEPADATFTLQKTTPFTLRLGYDPATGIYQDKVLETKDFPALPAESQFHDSLGYYPGMYYPGDGYLYFWDVDSSLAVPAVDNYTTRVTLLDNTPFYGLYGYDMGDTILGSGNPGDDGVQYGLHIAVAAKDSKGKWGMIQVWNSSAVMDLATRVDKTSVYPGGLLKYTLQIKNTTPAIQTFTLDNPIPENTSFVMGLFYKPKDKAIHWDGVLPPRMTLRLDFWVRVKSGTPKGTEIINTTTLVDDALGETATVKTVVK